MDEQSPELQGMGRRERSRHRARQDILRAAARAFARVGFKCCTMAEIGSEADYTAPALYNYFQSKDAIALELGQFVLDELNGVLDEATTVAGSAEEILRARLGGLLRWAARERDLLYALYTLQWSGAILTEGSAMEASPVDAHFIAWFGEPWAQAAFPAGSAADLATALRGLSDAFYQRWIADPHAEPASVEVLIDRVIRLFMDGATGRRPQEG